jgi:hypothetical protein
MARRLINEQGYDPKKLQVLLGGWGHWKELHAQDPKTYPTEPDLSTPVPFPGETIVVPITALPTDVATPIEVPTAMAP